MGKILPKRVQKSLNLTVKTLLYRVSNNVVVATFTSSSQSSGQPQSMLELLFYKIGYIKDMSVASYVTAGRDSASHFSDVHFFGTLETSLRDSSGFALASGSITSSKRSASMVSGVLSTKSDVLLTSCIFLLPCLASSGGGYCWFCRHSEGLSRFDCRPFLNFGGPLDLVLSDIYVNDFNLLLNTHCQT